MVASGVCYLDASALVKFVIPEPESAPLRAFIRGYSRRATSRLAMVEVPRAVERRGPKGQERAAAVLAGVALIDLDEATAMVAASASPAALRTLDAIHLASAIGLGSDLAVLVTYDTRLADAARAAGLEVVAPA